MDVRQARPTDAPLVLALALDESSHLVRGTDWPESNPTTRTILDSLLPMVLPGRVWIARAQACVALLEAQPRSYAMGWDISRLAVRGHNEEALAAVVLAATDHVQRRGIPRVFARCDDRGFEALCPLGFRPIAREFLLSGCGPSEPRGVPPPAGSRYRMPQDAWPLHQLASVVTPALVRQLEGSTSLEWSERPGKVVEVVVERESQVIAWAGWRSRPRRGLTQLGMVVHPNHADLAPALLAHAIDQVAHGSQFLARVREYHENVLQALLDAGFQTIARETVTVKHGLLVPAPVRRKVRVAGIPTIPIAPIAVRTGSGTSPATCGRER